MIVDVLLLLIGLAGLYFVRQATAAIVEIRRDVEATRKQAKEALRMVQKTDAHAARVLDRAYRNQQQIDQLMDSPHVRAAIDYTATHPQS